MQLTWSKLLVNRKRPVVRAVMYDAIGMTLIAMIEPELRMRLLWVAPTPLPLVLIMGFNLGWGIAY